MSEPIPAEITIGGKLPEFLVLPFCQVIQVQSVSLEWGDAWFQPATADDLLSACSDWDGQQVLVLRDDQANYGEFVLLERFLIEHNLSFDRRSEPRFEYPAQRVAFRPGQQPSVIPVSSDGEPIVRLAALTPVQALLDSALVKQKAGLHRAALRLLEQAAKDFAAALPSLPSPLTSLEIENPYGSKPGERAGCSALLATSPG